MFKKTILCLCFCWFASMVLAFDLSDLQKQLQSADNIKGSFTQKRYLKNLSKPIVSQGQFVLVPNAGLLWQMQKPFVDTMRVRKSGIEQLNAQQKWVAVAQSASAQKNQVKLFLDLLGGQTTGLQGQFDLVMHGNAQNWQLKMQPKTALMRQIFTKIEIGGGATVQKISLYEKQGDYTEITFINSLKNTSLNSFEKTAILP